MSKEYLMIEYDDQLDNVVDKVNAILEEYELQFVLDDEKNEKSYEDCDGRMWWTLRESLNCFKCPECGSRRFGTENSNDPAERWIRNCHGDFCDFSWNMNDDSKYGI